MLKFAANISLMFTEHPFLDRFKAAADAGFNGVEFLFPYAWEPDEIRTRLDENELTLVLFNIHPGNWDKGERGLTALKGHEDEFVSELDKALHYANALGCNQIHAMAGLNEHGANKKTYVENLKLAAREAKSAGIDILIEPINTHDIPGYFLNTTQMAVDVIDRVDAENLGLQFDLYHRDMMEGDVAGALTQFGPRARHFQIAGPPDRGEPMPSRLDYTPLFNEIDVSGYDGWIGCEYKPREDTLAGLRWIEPYQKISS